MESNITYDKKLEEMQKYLPFLRKIIEKLKLNNNNADDHPRKGQLQKMEMLHNLLTSKEKKLKIDTLLKCEGVLIKLHSKMEKNNSQHNASTPNAWSGKGIANSKPSPVSISDDIIDITGPSSPPASPTAQNVPTILPVEIPTERCDDAAIVVESFPNPLVNNEPQRGSQKNVQAPGNVPQEYHRHSSGSHSNTWHEKSSIRNAQKPLIVETAKKSVSVDHLSSSHLNVKLNSPRPLTTTPTTSSISLGVATSSSTHKSNLPFSRNRVGDVPVEKPPPATPPLHGGTHSGAKTMYSPEESWDEIVSNKTTTTTVKSSHSKSAPIIDLSHDGSTEKHFNNTYNKIIYQYKKSHNDGGVEVGKRFVENRKEEKTNLFSRFGSRVSTTPNSQFENFSMNVKNDRLKAAADTPMSFSSGAKTMSTTPAIPSTKLAQPQLADVLKSPPLSAQDISQLLDETVSGGGVVEPIFAPQSISGIGTRRPPKPTELDIKATTPTSSLDMVRKKFALITRNSPQFTDSPASPPPQHQPVVSSQTNERLALKYHPHPRVERTDAFPASPVYIESSSTHIRTDPRRNVMKSAPLPVPPVNAISAAPYNVLPSINFNDPRLKKSALPQLPATNTSIPSLLSLQVAPPMANFNPLLNTTPNVDDRMQMKASQPLMNNYPQTINQDPISKHVAPKINVDPMYKNVAAAPHIKPQMPPHVQPAASSIQGTTKPMTQRKYSSDENWDSEPETGQTTLPAKPLLPTPNKPSLLLTSSALPSVMNKTPNTPIATKNTWQKTTTKTANSGGYESEENWDSDPEPSTAPVKTSTPLNFNATSKPVLAAEPPMYSTSDPRLSRVNAPPTLHAYSPRSHDNHGEISHSANPFSLFGEPRVGNVKTPLLPTPTNSNCNRFSALLNDQKERLKYFESKKQKQTPAQPRTYAEFKEAKARAAAEEAAAREAAAKEAAAKEAAAHRASTAANVNETASAKLGASQKQQQHQHNFSKDATTTKFEADKNKAPNKSKDIKPKDAQKKSAVTPTPETNLDKLYRGSNFDSGTELVKTISNFKIPKKHVEKEVPKDNVVVPEEKSKDNIVEPMEKSEDEMKSKDQGEGAFENLVQNNEQETSEPTESEINYEQQETTQKNQVPKKKKINRARKKKNYKNNIENTQAVEPTEVEENSGEKQEGATSETEDVIENQKKNVKRVGKKKTQKQQKAATAENEENTDLSLSVNMDESAVSSSALAAGELTPTHSDQTRTEKELQFDELLQKLSPKSKAVGGPSQQPQRIMRRRCTMIAYGSAPEVDKQKILSDNALLFEDLQDREKLEQKAEEMKKYTTRKSKNLADMFQKTDDSCTVSTQNILSGKRRTRAKINFNEVQRTIAVFKHKKLQDIKKEVKEDESSSNVVVEVAATKKITKKAAKSRQIVSEDQSCAVSSTTSQPEETASSSSKSNQVTKKKKIVHDGRDDEPSSSAKSSNSTPTPALDEEERKQEFLENFLRDLKDPNSNQEFILGLLSQILSNEKFQLVKKVLESKREEEHEEEEEDGGSAHAVEDADEEAGEVEAEVAVEETLEDKKDLKIEEVKKVTVAKRGRRQAKAIRKKRKNELDRLNLDIRDMFISEGVITATGRRMCTLAAVAEAGTKTDTITVANKRQTKKATPEPVAVVSEVKSLPLRIRKSKVVISPLNLKLLHDSMSSKGNTDSSAHIEEENDKKIEEENDETSNKAKNKNKLKIKLESNENSQEADTPSQRKMPVLKPNTPIKLLEEEQQLEAFEEKIKPKTQSKTIKKTNLKPKSKPCPKSKKPTMIAEPADDALASDMDTSGDSEDDIQLAHLRKRIKSSNDEVEQQPAEMESLTKLESGKQMNTIANTNLHWHALSKYAHWCVICDSRVLYVASHYKQHHNNCEHYASRMAPPILQQYKQGKLNVPLFGTSRRTQIYWFYRCPFCLVHNRNVTRGWMEHFITHTGEYIYECSNCHKGGNKQVAIDKHTKRVCPGATVLRNEYQLNHKTIKAHICHMCNFLQLNRYNLERHFIQQHGCDPENVTVLGYSIVLMNCTGVEVVSAEKADELEAAALEKHTQESVVSIDDDDEKIKEDEEETLISAKTVTPSKVVVKPKPKPASRKKGAKTSMSSKKEYEASETSLYPSAVLYSENVVSDSLTDIKKSSAEVENEEDKVAKFISDAQDDVLAAAEKAESEEKAREAALSSNIFMPTVRTNTDSPTIDCLTQSLRTIEQAEEELQQQQQQHMLNTSTPHQDTTTQMTGSKATSYASVMSMADRLSQRFKDIQELNKTVASLTEQPTRVSVEKEQLSQEQQQTFSMTSVHSETASTSEGNLIIDEESQYIEATNEEGSVIELQEVDDNEDDGNWEDIEISETAPSGATNSGINNNKDKSKKKRIYQSLNRLYASLNKKGTNKQQTKKNPVISTVSSTNKKPLVLQQPVKQQELEKSKAIDNQCPVPVSVATQSSVSNTRTLISNLQDLLPDSPCNDPMELVPELAPVEPLQDLNDISAILDANFNPMDSQSMLQQMDMSLPEDSICINAEGQQQSIQDALEFVTEQQKQDVEQTSLATSSFSVQLNAGAVNIASAPQQTSINRIQNLGYLKTIGGGSKFYCLTVNCSFMFSNDAYGLENHFLVEHSQMKWDGYCFTCNQQVMPQDEQIFTLGAEMQHMLKFHIEAKEPPSEDESNGKQDSMPRIKLRRLTGDCLSSTPTQLQTPDQTLDIASNDITNMTLSDLLNAEPRPVNIKPTYPLHTPNVIGIADNIAGAEQDALPLFKNMSSDFAITAVASVGTKMAVPSTNEQTPTECQLQISNVRSLNAVTLNKAGATITQSKADCPITLPKISNVCSLNVRAANSPKTIQWQQQVEQNESVPLYEATQESSEVTGILAGALVRSNNNLGELKKSRTVADLLRDDSPTLVAETVPVSTGTCGEFLITQTVSAQYDDAMITGNGVLPHLDFNISIAPNVTATDSLRNNASIEEMTVPQVAGTPMRAQFKCMGNGCKYQTHLLTAINKHLHFHESRNFTNKREYLRCCLCENVAEDVNNYIIHAKTQHREELCSGTSATSTSNGTANTSSKTTQNVQKHLKDTAINKGNNKGVVQEISTSNADEVPFRKQLEQTIKEIVEPTGLLESQLYRCVIDGCTTSLTEASFHTHLVYHLTTLGIININNYDYKCPHCSSVYHRPNGIKAHLKSHARHSYFCFVCMTTAVNVPQLLKHFCEKHWKVANINVMPLLCIATSGAKSEPANYFVAHGGKKLSPLDIQQFGEKLVSVWQNKKAASKTHFKPSEIKMLPMQPIFRNEVYCASCLYKTKVRTNMYRHLQMHNSSNGSNSGTQVHVASVDPVNPVPCLNSNERHFDKMCNLASSSLVTGANASAVAKPVFKPPYVFIPDWSRLTCGVPGCQYLTVSEDIFRSHLSTLHQPTVQQYSCPFCKEELCTRSLNVERIIQHTRFHGQKLYQCEECDYLHYMKNVIERHINERHATLRVNLITHDRSVENQAEGTRTTQTVTGKKFKENMLAKPATLNENSNNSDSAPNDGNTNNVTSIATAKDSKLKWECDLCKHRTMTHNQMINHCNTKHSCKHQYQCVHCQFGSTQLAHIMTHIDDKHPAKTREARYIFHKIFSSAQEREADTRPLWQRDDPTRVRHIRGILMEDEEESEQYRKRLRLDEIDDDEDDAMDNTMEEELEDFVTLKKKEDNNDDSSDKTSPTIESNAKDYKFSCFHCDYRTNNFAELRNQHWQNVHNAVELSAKPFYFRLLITLRCAECNKFTGDPSELQLHMQNVHNTRVYIAADADETKPSTCGYCDYSYPRIDNLTKHFQNVAHKPHDLKNFQSEQLATMTTLGELETYLQCVLCTDLFANRMAIVEHASTAHVGEENFAFKELENSIMYRCPICCFSATEELTTLRHMIDHYGAFKRCVFCCEEQASFNAYMQHCYTEHRSEIALFSKIYTLHEISKFLRNILLIFPNGLVINKKNLVVTPYGCNKLISSVYKEICKTAQEPPIPRLSIARLVARKSIEAKASSFGSSDEQEQKEQRSMTNVNAAPLQTHANVVTKQAKKIAKRRQTVAYDVRGDFKTPEVLFNSADDNFLAPKKKRKTSENMLTTLLPPPTTPALPALPAPPAPPPPMTTLPTDEVVEVPCPAEPYSFYGKEVEPMDLSKIYTKVAIGGGIDTPLTIEKFKMLFKIETKVVLEKLDYEEIRKQLYGVDEASNVCTYEQYQHVKKACPASHKKKYI